MRSAFFTVLLVLPTFTHAAETTPIKPRPYDPLTADRLGQLLQLADANATRTGSSWKLTVGKRSLLVVVDERADRMRIMTPVVRVDGVTPEQLYRILQANFESALDARYAIAKGIVWGVFIHPLSPLQDTQVLSAIAQVVNVADTFGSSFSSGALMFNGGDTPAEQKALHDRLKGLLKPDT